VHHTAFGIPRSYDGTSMAVPHVSATAALVIASGLLGRNPTPEAVRRRLETTARDLGVPGFDPNYGYGLINAAAATDPAVPVS
jgi:serine protease